MSFDSLILAPCFLCVVLPAARDISAPPSFDFLLSPGRIMGCSYGALKARRLPMDGNRKRRGSREGTIRGGLPPSGMGGRLDNH